MVLFWTVETFYFLQASLLQEHHGSSQSFGQSRWLWRLSLSLQQRYHVLSWQFDLRRTSKVQISFIWRVLRFNGQRHIPLDYPNLQNIKEVKVCHSQSISLSCYSCKRLNIFRNGGFEFGVRNPLRNFNFSQFAQDADDLLKALRFGELLQLNATSEIMNFENMTRVLGTFDNVKVRVF